MKRMFRNSFRVALVLAAFTLSGTAFAQATRTWVSGVGDDANPCSRTAPCKTFAGAISKTAAGGEINVIDPGGFGTVTITKSITIDGSGAHASILAAGGINGININGVGIKVTLRNLSINGVGDSSAPAANGIRFLNGSSLTLENMHITGFNQYGIDFSPSATAELFVNNSTISNVPSATLGGAILVKPGVGASVAGEIRNVHIINSQFGIRIEDRSSISLSDCVISGNSNNGLVVTANAESAQATVDNCLVSNNGGSATHAGVKSVGGLATVNISNNTITHNFVGLQSSSGGAIVSLGNNTVVDNGIDGNPTSTVTTR